VPEIIRVESISDKRYSIETIHNFFQRIPKNIEQEKKIVENMYFEGKKSSDIFNQIESLNVIDILYRFDSKFEVLSN
jgi:hypothetical protein